MEMVLGEAFFLEVSRRHGFSSSPTWKGTGQVMSFAIRLLNFWEMLSHEFGEWGY